MPASWPGEADESRQRRPQRGAARPGRTRRRRCATPSRRSIATPRASCERGGLSRERRRARRRGASGSGARASSHRRTSAGTVVSALGSTRMRAAVTTKPGSPPARSSAATIRRAAAASASRRSSRRVVPAWSARPCSVGAQPHARGQRAHRPGGRAGALEVARLVDVQLEEAAQPREPARRRRRARPGRPRPRASPRASVTPSSSARARTVGEVEPPDERAGAERRRVEARALLVGEGDHGDAARGAAGDREGRGDAERAVEAPAAAHAVQVRADRPPRARRVRAAPTAGPPGRARRAARRRSPARRTTPPRRPLRRPRQPRGAVRARADRLQAGEPVAQVRGGDHRAIRHAWSGAHPHQLAAGKTAATGLWPKRYGTCSTGPSSSEHVAALADLERADLVRPAAAPRRR